MSLLTCSQLNPGAALWKEVKLIKLAATEECDKQLSFGAGAADLARSHLTPSSGVFEKGRIRILFLFWNSSILLFLGNSFWALMQVGGMEPSASY